MTLRRRGGETFILAKVKELSWSFVFGKSESFTERWEWANTGGQLVADWGWAEEPFNSDEENCLAWSVSSASSFW